LTEVAILTKL